MVACACVWIGVGAAATVGRPSSEVISEAVFLSAAVLLLFIASPPCVIKQDQDVIFLRC